MKWIIGRGFITVNFYSAKGEKKSVKAEPGETILRIAQHNGIPLEGTGVLYLIIKVHVKEVWLVQLVM